MNSSVKLQYTERSLTFSVERLAGAGVGLVFLDERKDVNEVKHMALTAQNCHSENKSQKTAPVTVGVGEGLEGDGAVVEREPLEVNLVWVIPTAVQSKCTVFCVQ